MKCMGVSHKSLCHSPRNCSRGPYEGGVVWNTLSYKEIETQKREPALWPFHIWLVVKVMVPYWIPIIIWPLRDHYFDNHPYAP